MSASSDKILVLDRDGVINVDINGYIGCPTLWHPIDGSLDALVKAQQAGFRLAVATNQSGVGRGIFSADDLQSVHEKMEFILAERGVKLDIIEHCPHAPEEGCDCRKPEPGMLEAIERQLAVDLQGAWFVGDSVRDLQAAVAHGMQPVLVLTGNGQTSLADPECPANTLVFDDLAHCVDVLLTQQ